MDSGFKDWTIEKCIGEGAFGKVYKIVREDFGHIYEAALKVLEIPHNQAEADALLNEGFSQLEMDEYFYSMVEDIVDEFTLMSKLKGNSNIVSYEDHAVVKKEDGYGWRIYIRMELLTGIFTQAKSVDFTNKDVLQLGIDICKALEVCQKYHIIHRDIKPENIFISDVGTYKLGDFGIARELEKTSAGLSKKGTRSYMAPEVYKGMEYNATVDIYSLGIVLYRFLNGNRLPFLPPVPERIRYSDKEAADVMRMSGQSMPAPLYASSELTNVIWKACAYVPSDRYASAKEMREDLEKVMHSEEEKTVLFCQDMNLKTIGTGSTKVPDKIKVESVLENCSEESTMLPTYEETGADTIFTVGELKIENIVLEKKQKRVVLGSVLVCLFIGIAGIGMYSIWGDTKEVTGRENITFSPIVTTVSLTSEPTNKPMEIPTKKPKKSRKPVATKEVVTDKMTITAKPMITKVPTVTNAPVVTKQPERTKKPKEDSQIIIDDSNVTVE